MGGSDFLQSECEAVLRLVRPFEVHGARFCELGFSLPEDPESSIRRARISDNLIYGGAKSGDRVRISFLMGSVMRVAKVE